MNNYEIRIGSNILKTAACNLVTALKNLDISFYRLHHNNRYRPNGTYYGWGHYNNNHVHIDARWVEKAGGFSS